MGMAIWHSQFSAELLSAEADSSSVLAQVICSSRNCAESCYIFTGQLIFRTVLLHLLLLLRPVAWRLVLQPFGLVEFAVRKRALVAPEFAEFAEGFSASWVTRGIASSVARTLIVYR